MQNTELNVIDAEVEKTNDLKEEMSINEPFDRTFFAQKPKKILKQFKEHNQIDSLLLEGTYERSPVLEKNFGFFTDIESLDGKKLTYPEPYGPVEKIYIKTTELKNEERYQFEVTVATKFEIDKQQNPFLLQAINNGKIKDVYEIGILLENKKKQLKEEEKNIGDIKNKRQRIQNDIVEKKEELDSINKLIEKTNKKLKDMENLISTLKSRVSICRNLEFISKDEEDRYLNLLSEKKIKLSDHLDFENDFGSNFAELSDHIHAYLYKEKHLIYTRYQIKNFLTLIRTHDIIVLSGLSGSGKTQIVKAFAEALGGIAKIIPVKPNWTSSDDLIGYFNPLQNTFLPTPFTEVIVEAIYNPNQIYFICLDEMNLARAEYYFADFLSKLEERNQQPEIELYANHEEEFFISEFTTLLNLIESSIKDKNIKSWQEFLDNAETRRAFFDMLGNVDKESMLQLHIKMKRRLIDILKFPSTIKIPENVRFIGAINVDETTHYFSPKILDRIHVVKFDNPLLIEEQIANYFEHIEIEKELKPVHIYPKQLAERKEYPSVTEFPEITDVLKEINQKFLLPLNIDFGIRSIRQSLNYAELNKAVYELENVFNISLNTIILQKILPRFIFDGSETAKNGKSKLDVVKDFNKYLNEFYKEDEIDEIGIGKTCNKYLNELIEQTEKNSNSQFNFFA